MTQLPDKNKNLSEWYKHEVCDESEVEPMGEPTIEQIMRCHRMMVDSFADYNYPAEKIAELNELEKLCGPFDVHEILYKEIEALRTELEHLKTERAKDREVLEFYGEPDNWIGREHIEDEAEDVNMEAVSKNTPWHGEVITAGKRARARLKEGAE